MVEITVKTHTTDEMIDITNKIQFVIPEHFNGICHVFCPHTTAGVTVNENADPDVRTDFIFILDKLISRYHISYKHVEGNSAAHVKSSLMGVSATLPVSNGRLALGCWQGLYFCEFDGPRTRRVVVSLLGSPE